MCGIVGILTLGTAAYDLAARIATMSKSLTHRGPDSVGDWIDKSSGVGFGHRRLSVIDLSPAGAQPMISHDQRYVLTFNGEIYNNAALRRDLNGIVWRGHSDTEVFLAAICAWGLVEALTRASGMFAFGLWDRHERRLTIARDRLGEKPLYYGRIGAEFVFASELKAICALPDMALEINPEAVSLMIRYGYVPTPYSIYKAIEKLPPGTLLQVSRKCNVSGPQAWWSITSVIGRGLRTPAELSDLEATDRLEEILTSSVKSQMASDVPLGAMLSGGIDSSTIAALMQAHSARPVKTFSVGFTENLYDESKYAAKVAQYLHTDHTELIISPQEAMQAIPNLSEIYDEPFGDSSQIPTALICALTRRHVTVCLSGDGADEVFGGYNRYIMGAYYWNTFQPIPMTIKKAVAKFVLSISANTFNSILARMNPFLPKSIRLSNPGEMLHKLASIMDAPSADIVYRRLVSQCDEKTKPTNTITPDAFLDDSRRWPQLPHFAERMMALDSLTYLPDDILVKVDRASMAASLETRAPYLNERVIEFAWKLPMHQKIRAGQGKWLLRQVLDRYVPKQFIDRPKQGFGIPLADWLRGPLRGWAEDLLSPSKLSSDGLLNSARVQTMWKAHLKGSNYQHALWNILMYQAWRSRWG